MLDRMRQAVGIETQITPPTYPDYKLTYTARGVTRPDTDPRVVACNTLLAGLNTIAQVGHYNALILDDPQASDTKRALAFDTNRLKLNMDMLEALTHLGRVAYVIAGGSESYFGKSGWEDTKKYIADIPQDEFYGRQANQRRTAVNNVNSKQPMYLRTSANVLTTHVMHISNTMLAPYSGDDQLSRLPSQSKQVLVDSPEELDVRSRMFSIVTHDTANILTSGKAYQQMRERTMGKLSELSAAEGIWETEKLAAELAMRQSRLRTNESQIRDFWHGSVDRMSKIASLMREPYPRDGKSVTGWAENIQLVAERYMTSHAKSSLLISIDASSLDKTASAVWSTVWLESLVENAAQNLLRARDGMLGIPQLRINVRTVGNEFVARFVDNGPGFRNEDFFRKGFDGTHGKYLSTASNQQSTGTAMKSLVDMASRYMGTLKPYNVYKYPDGRESMSDDPELISKDADHIAGAALEFRIPLNA